MLTLASVCTFFHCKDIAKCGSPICELGLTIPRENKGDDMYGLRFSSSVSPRYLRLIENMHSHFPEVLKTSDLPYCSTHLV